MKSYRGRTKIELIKKVSKTTKLHKAVVRQIIDCCLEIIIQETQKTNGIEIAKFGRFLSRSRGGNHTVTIKNAYNIPKFRPTMDFMKEVAINNIQSRFAKHDDLGEDWEEHAIIHYYDKMSIIWY